MRSISLAYRQTCRKARSTDDDSGITHDHVERIVGLPLAIGSLATVRSEFGSVTIAQGRSVLLAHATSGSYHQPLVQVVSHATKRTSRSMQSPPILRTRNKRFFIRLLRGGRGWSSAMAT